MDCESSMSTSPAWATTLAGTDVATVARGWGVQRTRYSATVLEAFSAYGSSASKPMQVAIAVMRRVRRYGAGMGCC